jgi:flagellar motor switch protein FliN/FliY
MGVAEAKWLAAAWNDRFTEIMMTMADVKPRMEFTPVDAVPRAELLWWKQEFSCAPESPLWIGVIDPVWNMIARLLLTAAGVDNPPLPEVRSTYLEILRQSMGSLAQEIGSRLSRQVSCLEGEETPPWAARRRLFELDAAVPDVPAFTLFLAVSDSLADCIAGQTPAPAQPEEPAPAPHLNSDETISQVASSRTFELLLDVALPISVSFGRASLRIHDAMRLISGSMIELDRALTDPVELLVNDCVIARGEVVVVEGNYGVRLTEIVSHRERLRQSRRYMLG